MKILYDQYQLETVIFIFCLYIFIAFVNGWYKLSPKPLYEHPFFWASIFLPVLIFCICAYYDLQNKTISNNSIEQYDISTFTLSILALVLPATTILAAIHRSIQTDEQIKVTEKKNESDKYYAHQKYIVECLNSLTKYEVKSSWNNNDNSRVITVSNPHKLYRQAFKKSSPENVSFELNEFINQAFPALWKWLNEELCLLHKNNSPAISANFLYKAEGRLVGLSRHLGFSRPNGPWSANINNNFNLITSFLSEEEFIRTIHYYNEVTSEVCDILNIEIDFGKICPDVMNYIYGGKKILQCYHPNFIGYMPYKQPMFT
ncbi:MULTISPECIES: hypothetical protein [Enterobacter cloacae complex]|uniref:hypothetical protein n=1 Tax=Enterobacter cloacae complex TaxID=354276 RepID=UPI0006DBE87A|nr:hypothetical protein [Enterobacter roggenkampii]OEG98025.1 hypothetical protein AN685_0221800 [Enterobacter roggenkampii]HAS0802370.1 hypothetical protein [Enterobacter roggenkampii]HAT7719953.1 hypothetical protein [Enterobacter roggenkampii]HDT6073747.1 hypothetical protein [Enterobacter roggenkampii]